MTKNVKEASVGLHQLSQLAEKKEEELREVKGLQLAALQKELDEKDKSLKLERMRFQCLKDDFEYNLKIIEQRDTELLQYEKIFTELRENENFRNTEISDMKIKIEELQSKLEQCEKEKTELENYYRKRTSDLQNQVNFSLTEKNKEIQNEKENYLKFKRSTERRMQEAENEMEEQKRQLLFGFDEEMNKRDKEFREKTDELDNALHAKEIHLKMISKELQILREGSFRISEEKGELGDQVIALKKELEKKSWEIKDIENMAQVKLSEMKQKLSAVENERQNMRIEFNRTCSNLDKTVNAKEQQCKALQEAADEKEQALKSEIESLMNEIEKGEAKMKRLVWDFNDRLKERDVKIQSLENVITEKDSKAKLEYASFTQAVTSRDLEIEGLKTLNENSASHISNLSLDLKSLRMEHERLKEQEVLITQSKEDLELHWQQKYENASHNAGVKWQSLIESLQNKVILAQKDVEEKAKELEQRENLIKVLTRDKNIAYSLLKKNGIDMKGISIVFEELVAKDDLDTVMQQNEELKKLISMMRKEIEGIEDRHRKEINLASLQYANDLEEQLRQLKADKRKLANVIHDLQEQLDEAKRQKKVTFIDSSIRDIAGESKQSVQGKLKSAAKQIQDLVLERARLQSLGNKLRNEVNSLKEQLSAGDVLANAEKIKGNVRRADLKNMEDMHYKLAMEEFRDRPIGLPKNIDVELASSSESSLSNDQSDADGLIEQFPVKDVEGDPLSEKYFSGKSSTPTNDNEKERAKTHHAKAAVFNSSSELSSLQDLWKILDEAESLASQTPRSARSLRAVSNLQRTSEKKTDKTEQVEAGFSEVEGHQMVLRSKEAAKETKLSKLARGKFSPMKKPQRKIRNYNVKDDL